MAELSDHVATLNRKRDQAGLVAVQPTPTSLFANENDLHAEMKRLVDRSNRLKVIRYEYNVVPRQNQYGVGDFLLKRVGEKTLVVVEVKYINFANAGRNASTSKTSRTKNRKKVKEQARKYADLASAKFPAYKILVYIFTNENVKPIKLGELKPRTLRKKCAIHF